MIPAYTASTQPRQEHKEGKQNSKDDFDFEKKKLQSA